VKLCDFGFAAKMAQSGITLGMGTSTNSESTLMDGCGTAMYVAPEIAEGFMKRAHGFPVDWWSLGCVLFEMLTGTAPFGDTEKMSKFEVFNNIAHRDVSCPLLWSKQLKDIVRGLLRKDPSTRFSWVNIELSEWLGMVNTPWFFCLHRILFFCSVCRSNGKRYKQNHCCRHGCHRYLLRRPLREFRCLLCSCVAHNRLMRNRNFVSWQSTLNVNDPADPMVCCRLIVSFTVIPS
jgi:serine/threonine protein kinase